MGFFNGLIFSWVYVQQTNGSGGLSGILVAVFGAFILSFFMFQKNRMKLFYTLIALSIFKWIFDIMYMNRLFNVEYEIKLWAVFLFFWGVYLTYKNLLKNKTY